jgi:hypothetical protein
MDKEFDLIMEIYTNGITNTVKYIPVGTTVSEEKATPLCIGKVKLKYGALPLDEPVVFEHLKLNQQ